MNVYRGGQVEVSRRYKRGREFSIVLHTQGKDTTIWDSLHLTYDEGMELRKMLTNALRGGRNRKSTVEISVAAVPA